jgi:hypothetical protein
MSSVARWRLERAIEHGALELLRRLLRQVAQPRALGDDAVAGLGAVLAEQHLEQRRLAGAVRADERDAIARPEHPVEVVEQDARADRVADSVELDHGRLSGRSRCVRG